MVKRRGRKRKSPAWLYPVLWGTLALLLLLLVYPSSSEYVDVQTSQAPVVEKPVYEDVKAAPVEIEPRQRVVVKPRVKAQQPIAVEAIPSQPLSKGLALVIDDVGYDLPALKRILALPFTMTISIIPDAPHAREAAEMAHKAHRTVMLHMPMEPSNPHYRAKMDDSFLRVDMNQTQVYAMLQKGLRKVPYAEGMNNHMGSLLTAMPEPMDWVMLFCRENNLFFVDSKTSSKSVAADIAQDYGLTWGARRIFLDHSVELDDIQKAWHSAMLCAQKKGGCIMIGHPHPETLNFLESKAVAEHGGIMRDVKDLLHTPRVK